MKWFKHMSDSLEDPFIFDLVSKFGGDGYLVFFGTLEVISREFDQNMPGICQISERFLTKKLQISKKKLQKILKFCHFHGKIMVDFSADVLTLNCPKFKDFCDEYTKKKAKESRGEISGQYPDKLRTNSGACPENIHIEQEQEQEEEEDITKVITAGASAPVPAVPFFDSEKGSPLPDKKDSNQGPIPEDLEKSRKHFSETVGHLLPVMESMAKDISSCKPDKGFNPYAFIQKKVNDGIHPEIIVSALKIIRENWTKMEKDPWSYTSKLIKRAQIEKETAGYKAMTYKDLAPGVAEILARMLKCAEIPKDDKKNVEERKAQLRKQVETLKGGFLNGMD